MHDLHNFVDMIYFILFTAVIAFLFAILALNVAQLRNGLPVAKMW